MATLLVRPMGSPVVRYSSAILQCTTEVAPYRVALRRCIAPDLDVIVVLPSVGVIISVSAGEVANILAGYGVVWYGMVWYGKVWCDKVQ